jgi:hypothetical protein
LCAARFQTRGAPFGSAESRLHRKGGNVCGSEGVSAVRAVGAFLVALVVIGCHFGEYVTPDPHDKAYPCHRADGSADPNANWCFPVDGSHTCCPERSSCASLEGQPICAYQGPEVGPGGLFEARRPVARTPEHP